MARTPSADRVSGMDDVTAVCESKRGELMNLTTAMPTETSSGEESQ